MATEYIYIGADMSLEYKTARIKNDDDTYTYLNSGTCTWKLLDEARSEISNGTLSYVAASNGKYTGTIESTVTNLLTRYKAYFIIITFAQTVYNDEREIRCIADLRKSN